MTKDLEEEFVEGVLAHYGVQGMKWGVRRERGALRRGLTKANVSLDASTKAVAEPGLGVLFLSTEKRNKAASATRTRVLAESVDVNRDPRFKGKDLKGNPGLKKAYFNEVTKRATEIYKEELGIARTEAFGDFLGVKVEGGNAIRFEGTRSRIKHAETDDKETLLLLSFTMNKLGHIVDVTVIDQAAKHDAIIDRFLAHTNFGMPIKYLR